MRIREYHQAGDGVMCMPWRHEELSYAGETASCNRVARLMSRHGLLGVPPRRPVRSKRTGVRPDHVRNHLERDFSPLESNTKWVTDITCIHTGEGLLYPCTVLDLYSHEIVSWSMSGQLRALIPGQRFAELFGQRRDLRSDGIADGFGAVSGQRGPVLDSGIETVTPHGWQVQ